MFSLKVIDTDNFLDMSPTAQLLYFHLAMRADDDGFVSSPKKIMKLANVPVDDMRTLIEKRYLIPFHSGVCVIKDWSIHNLIRSDRYTETEYKDEKACLSKVDGKYVLNSGFPEHVIPTGNQMEPQVRLGKVRLSNSNNNIKEKKEENTPLFRKRSYLKNIPTKDYEYFQENYQASKKEVDTIADQIDSYCASKGKTYRDYKAAIRAWIQKKQEWETERGGKVGKHIDFDQLKAEGKI